MHSLIGRYLDEIVNQKNLSPCICNHSIVLGLIIRYATSLTQYLSYSRSLP